MTKRAILYARVSTERQQDNTSLEGQIGRLKEEAGRRGYAVAEMVQDVGSGVDFDREGINRVRELAHAKRADVVMFEYADRLGREMSNSIYTLAELKRIPGFGVEFLDIQPTGNDMADWMLIAAKFGAASEQWKSIREKTMKGRLDSARQGRIMVSRPLYGYNYCTERDPRTGRVARSWYEVNPEEAEVVRTVFRWFVLGDGNGPMSLRSIAYELTVRGIPKRGKDKWWRSTVHVLLANESYASGLWYFNRNESYGPLLPMKRGGKYRKHKERDRSEWIPVQIPPLVSRDLYEAARLRLQTNKASGENRAKYQYLLSGMLRCICGLGWTAKPQNKNGKLYLWYICRGVHKDSGLDRHSDRCRIPIMVAEWADRAVWDFVFERITDPKKLREMVHHQRQAAPENVTAWKREIANAHKVIDDCDKNLRALLDDALEGFPKAIVAEKRDQVMRVREAGEKRIAELQERIEEATVTEQQLHDAERIGQELLAAAQAGKLSFKKKRAVLKMLRVKVTVTGAEGGDGRGRKNQDRQHYLEVTGKVIGLGSLVSSSPR